MTLRIDNLTIWDGGEHVFSNASLLIENGQIAGICPTSEAGALPDHGQQIDGQGKLAIPGLVNGHTSWRIEPFAAATCMQGVSPSREFGTRMP